MSKPRFTMMPSDNCKGPAWAKVRAEVETHRSDEKIARQAARLCDIRTLKRKLDTVHMSRDAVAVTERVLATVLDCYLADGGDPALVDV